MRQVIVLLVGAAAAVELLVDMVQVLREGHGLVDQLLKILLVELDTATKVEIAITQQTFLVPVVEA
jgi:hypothetical protein